MFQKNQHKKRNERHAEEDKTHDLSRRNGFFHDDDILWIFAIFGGFCGVFCDFLLIFGHFFTNERIERNAEKIAHFNQLIEIGNRCARLPFGNGLARYVKNLRKVALG